ncbi:ABC transporter substrate-binding protein [Rhodoferax sp. PAMC 29310]|uniref:substrate-binding periplasmic protein n=1 Tax=Rhodoferax sp. PAMC 29310 TaxID=2822760 RepID=UPI001F0A4462|nr:transporter substrate-binding domain-containing protein [Rhodoferax sp. PAMC 29310]
MALPAAAQKPIIKIATGELAPYATESRTDQGIALSIVRKAFELQGYTVEYTFMPWSRTLTEAKIGKWDGTAYWGRKPEHESSFLISDNILTEQWVFVYRNALKFNWTALTDLRPYRMALIQDYTYTPEIWAMVKTGELTVERLANDEAALKMLLTNRIDVAPMERNVACDLLRRNFNTEEAHRLSVHPKLMTDSFTTHLMLPRSNSASAARMADFNQGVSKLRSSKDYANLLSQVSCPTGWVGGK